MSNMICLACEQQTAIWSADGKCPDCIAATTSFGDGRRKGVCVNCGKAKWLYGDNDECNACAVQEKDAITSPTYVHADCGCDYRDGEQTRWCTHHVSGMQETIRARDKSIAEYSTKVKLFERQRNDWKKHSDMFEGMLEKAIRERDEWKARAEQVAEEAERRHQNTLASICPDPDEHATVNILQGQQRYYADVRKERDKWKAKAEYWKERQEIARKHEDEALAELSCREHWCCYHMRWETPKGEEV